MRHKTFLLGICLALSAGGAYAGSYAELYTEPGEKPSYSYLQAGWLIDYDLDIEGSPINRENGTGWTLEGSLSLNDRLSLPDYIPGVFAFGETLSSESGSNNLDFDTMSFGLGVNHGVALGPAGYLDGFATVSFEEIDLGGTSDEGLGLGAGLRWLPVKGLEVNPYGRYLEYGSGSFDLDGWRYGVQLLANVTEKLALTAEWSEIRLETGSPSTSSGLMNDADLEAKNIITVGARLYY